MPTPTSGSNSKPLLILMALLSAEIVAAFEIGMIHAAVPVLQEIFGDSLIVGWIVSAYYLVAAGAALIGARLGDIYGRTKVLKYALVIAGMGSLLCAVMPESLTALLVGRGIQGASAAILPLCYGLAREFMPPTKVMPTIGLLAGAMGVAAGIGLLIGGLLIDYYEWNWIFYSSVTMTVISLSLVTLWIPNSKPAFIDNSIDYLGGILFPLGIILFLIGFTQSRYWGWDDPRVWALVISGLVILSIWTIYELRHKFPLVNLRLVADRQVALSLGCMILTCAAFQAPLVISIIIQAPVWTGLGLGFGALTLGALAMISQLAGMAGGVWAARLLQLRSARYAIITGGMILTASWGTLAVSFYAGYSSLLLTAICYTGYGLGSTIIYAIVPMALVESVPAENTSEATGIVSVVRQVFLGIFAQIITAILAISTVAHPTTPIHNYPSATALFYTATFITFCSILVILMALGLRGRSTAAIGGAGMQSA